MKSYCILGAALIAMAASAKANEPAKVGSYNPPEFIESEWNYIGEGTADPGFSDCLGKEEGGTMEYYKTVRTNVWEKKSTPGDYYISYITDDIEGYITDYENLPDNARDWIVPAPFYVHAQNKDKVWSEPIYWMSPLVFAWFHNVPEVMGMTAPTNYYAKMGEDRVIRFPASCFLLTTLPSGSMPSNLEGNFALGIPNPEGVAGIESDTLPAEYFNLNGIPVENPVNGLYIKKQGSKVTKVIIR